VDFKGQSALPKKNRRIPHIGVGDFRQELMTIYHIHLIENTGFLEDLFCKTKPFSAFQDGRIRGVAYILAEILCSYETVEK